MYKKYLNVQRLVCCLKMYNKYLIVQRLVCCLKMYNNVFRCTEARVLFKKV